MQVVWILKWGGPWCKFMLYCPVADGTDRPGFHTTVLSGANFWKILINGGGGQNKLGNGNFPKNLINIYSTFRVQKHTNNRR